MIDDPLYTLSEAAVIVGRPKNLPLLKALIHQHGIKTRTIARAIILDDAGVERLRRALAEWDNRPRLCRMQAASA